MCWFFFHLQPIEPHTELKVWYAADYAKFMEASAVFIKEESDVSPLPSVAVSTPYCALKPSLDIVNYGLFMCFLCLYNSSNASVNYTVPLTILAKQLLRERLFFLSCVCNPMELSDIVRSKCIT